MLHCPKRTTKAKNHREKNYDANKIVREKERDIENHSFVAQRKRDGPITHRTVDRNHAKLIAACSCERLSLFGCLVLVVLVVLGPENNCRLHPINPTGWHIEGGRERER
jgi:hypothetical protein